MGNSPARLIIAFFFIAISFGSFLLSLPFCRNPGFHYSYLTNLFTAVSAVCVTGLSVVDLHLYYSFAGQCVILFLIQIGGLGYMTLTTATALVLGGVSISERIVVKEYLDVSSFKDLLGLMLKIVGMIFAIELAGALLLFFAFLQEFSVGKAVFYGIFHSVSAFCNAGLSLFNNNLENYSANYFVLLTVSSLVIFGGIGFLTAKELFGKILRKGGNLSLHSRVVLWASLVLLVAGMLLFWLSERNSILNGAGFFYSFFNSFFHSVTSRTAGFSALPESMLSELNSIFTIILMFIGASPGGTGGGIKTTTAVLIFFFVLSIIRGDSKTNIGKRRMSTDVINRAIAILVLSAVLVALSTIALFITESGFSSLNMLFETVSAFGTVGLSRGITPLLSDAGRIVILITMFMGRVGVIAVLIAFIKKHSLTGFIGYPEEKIMVG